MTNRIVLLGAGLLALIAAEPARAEKPFKTPATPGTRHYRYTALEQAEGQQPSRYRVDFDLVTDASGGVTALIRKAEQAKGDTWTTAMVDAACTKSLHGDAHALARITLAPLTAAAADSLGEPFMAMCAPPAYFFPMTDILNVSLIQTSPVFHLADLTAVGASARFEGFKTKLDRLGSAIAASSPGGEIKLSALDEHSATIDWAPEPMQVTIVVHATQAQPETTMSGFENYAFRVELDRSTGALHRAVTTIDKLDMVIAMPGVPADRAPHVKVTREVTIEPRD